MTQRKHKSIASLGISNAEVNTCVVQGLERSQIAVPECSDDRCYFMRVSRPIACDPILRGVQQDKLGDQLREEGLLLYPPLVMPSFPITGLYHTTHVQHRDPSIERWR